MPSTKGRAAAKPPEAAHRTRRDDRRERTRQRLLEATLELVRWKGLSGVSVSEITKQVGVHHSLFYTHFETLDLCLAEAAKLVIAQLVPIDRETRLKAIQNGVIGVEENAVVLEKSFDLWLRDRAFVQLLLAHRSDRSPIGQALRDTYARLLDEATLELWDMFKGFGVDPKHMNEIRLLADLHGDAWFWAMSVLVEGRSADRALVARMLAETYDATFRRTLRRLRSAKG